jgi:hypothetical protein
MTTSYDNKCRQCDDGILRGEDGEETICNVCDGYGYLLTFEGHALLEFLKRRGYGEPMSPRAEEDLANMLGD